MGLGRPKQVRKLWGSLKDKVSVVKATALLLSRRRSAATATALRLAVVKATSHDPSTSPPPDFISDLVDLGHHSSASDAARDALLSRLHSTSDAFVALKCLLSLHHLLPFLSHDGNRLLNLSNFLDQSDPATWQLSLWARWFADEIDFSLSLSADLGSPVPPSAQLTDQDRRKKISALSNSGLLRELDALVSMVEQLGTAPDSLHYQTIGLLYDVMKLAGEDYRITMRQLFARIREIEDGERLGNLNEEGLNKLIGLLERLLGCKARMLLMFLNKKQNDGVWESIAEAKFKAKEEMRRRQNSKMVLVPERAGFHESARMPRGGRWLDVDWNKALTVPQRPEQWDICNFE